MLELNNVMASVYDGIRMKADKYGFAPVFPEGVKANEVPLKTRDNGSAFIDFTGDKGAVRILYSDNKIFMLIGENDVSDTDDKNLKKISTNLMILAEYGQRDVNSCVRELCETFDESFGVKNLVKINNKTPVTVSRADAKNGIKNYDTITLASRIADVYPELKTAYRDNINTYGEFLAEDFFVNHANKYIIDTIKSNEPKAMKRLFNQLNDIFDNGLNETQNIIAVTILGSINNNPAMIKNIIPYLGDAMLEPVIEVNKILGKSKSARMRLENPPKYKPKKKKNPMASMLGQQ